MFQFLKAGSLFLKFCISLGHLVAQGTDGMTRAAACHLCVNVLCFYDPFFVIIMYLGFVCHHKAGAHLHPFGPQHKCRGNTSAICDPPCGDHRNLHRICHLRHQYHCGALSNMAAGLTSLCHHRVCAAALHAFGQGYGGNHWNHADICLFPHFHIFLRIACTGGNYLYPFFRCHFCHLVGIGTHQHDVHTERLICNLFCLPNLLPHPLRRGICRADKPQTSCF